MSRPRLWGNRIVGVFALLLWVGFLAFLPAGVRIWAAVALAVLLVAAIVYDVTLPDALAVHLFMPSYGEKRKRVRVRLRIRKYGALPLLAGTLHVRLRRSVSGAEQRIEIPLSLFRRERVFAFEMHPEYMGFWEVRAERAELFGFFGCCKKTVALDKKKEYLVLPTCAELHFPVRNSGAVQEFFEEGVLGKKGFGVGDYFGIRPYVPGDSMKQIHWKLTGKTEEYLVKEMEIPQRKRPILLLETCLFKKEEHHIDTILETFFSVAAHLTQEGQAYTMRWYDTGALSWQQHEVESLAQLEEAYGLVFSAEFAESREPSLAHFPAEEQVFSEIIYVTGLWEGDAPEISEELPITLLFVREDERQEAQKERREALMPYTVTEEFMADDIDRIMTEYRGESDAS